MQNMPIKIAAWTLVAIHVLVLWSAGSRGGGSLSSNLVQLASASLAVLSCFLASRRMKGFASQFWGLMGLSFLLWSVAQAGFIYGEDFLHSPVPNILWVNILFFFFVAPMGFALLLPPDGEGKDSSWPLSLDIIQLGIVILTAYLYFVIPSFWRGRDVELNRLIRISSELRNYFLLAAFLLRLSLTSSRNVKPFKQMAIVIAIYSIGESLYFHLTPVAVINTGKWFDLVWSIPFALATVFACNNEHVDELGQVDSHGKPWKTTLAFHVMPLLIPLVVLGMATRIVAEQLLLAAISVAASVLCAIGRVFAANLTQEKAVIALKETEERFRLLFASNPRPSWVFELENLKFIEVNEAALEAYGYSRTEFLEAKVTDLLVAEDIPTFLRRVTTGAAEPYFGEAVHRTKNGGLINVAITATNVSISGRQARMVLAEDITERKKAEEELKQSQQKLALHVQRTPLAVIEWDVGCRVTEWNLAAERIFGYSRDEALGQHADFILTDDDRSGLFKVAASESGLRSTNENVRKSGERILCEWYNTPLVDLSGSALGSASLVQDVTEQRNLEQQLRQSQKMEAIGTLAGGVAHDFNNLLTVITGYSHLLSERFKADLEATAELQEITDASIRAAALTRQLLTFSRKQVIQPVLLDLNESVKRMQNMLRHLIGEDVIIETILADNLGRIRGDLGQIEQVIMNLAVNAREAMPKGGKLVFETRNSIKPDVSAETASPKAEIILIVRDTGVGIDAATQEHIFEPFFTTKTGTGTGLGLSTVFGIVQEAGGKIELESTVGRGTAFILYFPSVDMPKSDEKVSRQKAGTVKGGSETILLVEDDVALRELARVVLQNYGYRVLLAEPGEDALNVCVEFSQTIHLLLTDVVMPNLNGPELVERLKLKRPAMKVLYMSGYTKDALARQTTLDSTVNLLHKPFSPLSLASKVRDVLETQIASRPHSGSDEP